MNKGDTHELHQFGGNVEETSRLTLEIAGEATDIPAEYRRSQNDGNRLGVFASSEVHDMISERANAKV